MTNYTPAHSSSELSAVVIDFIVEYAIQIIAFVGLIALVGLYIWFRKALK